MTDNSRNQKADDLVVKYLPEIKEVGHTLEKLAGGNAQSGVGFFPDPSKVANAQKAQQLVETVRSAAEGLVKGAGDRLSESQTLHH